VRSPSDLLEPLAILRGDALHHTLHLACHMREADRIGKVPEPYFLLHFD